MATSESSGVGQLPAPNLENRSYQLASSTGTRTVRVCMSAACDKKSDHDPKDDWKTLRPLQKFLSAVDLEQDVSNHLTYFYSLMRLALNRVSAICSLAISRVIFTKRNIKDNPSRCGCNAARKHSLSLKIIKEHLGMLDIT